MFALERFQFHRSALRDRLDLRHLFRREVQITGQLRAPLVRKVALRALLAPIRCNRLGRALLFRRRKTNTPAYHDSGRENRHQPAHDFHSRCHSVHASSIASNEFVTDAITSVSGSAVSMVANVIAIASEDTTDAARIAFRNSGRNASVSSRLARQAARIRACTGNLTSAAAASGFASAALRS